MGLTGTEVDSAWGMMGGTTAGKNARVRLVEILTSVCPNADNLSALSRHEGRRSLARELLTLMDQNAQHDRSPADIDYPSPERKPVAISEPRSLRRVNASADDDARRAGGRDAARSRLPGSGA